ncbi:MAG: sigma-70 family RNA polymerase sigma factor, partial [Sphingobacterium sp.]
RNKILNIIAHKKVLAAHEASLQLFLDSKPVPTDYQTRDKQLALLIESEIQSLPKKMKEIFILSRKEHLSHKEISEKLNISEKTVKNQVNNALKILRSKFGLLIFLIYYLK